MANKSDKRSGFVHQIGYRWFYIEVFLYNQLDGYKPFPIPFLFIDSFSIEETLLNWITKGWIVLNTDFEILERGAPSVSNYNKNQDPLIDRPVPAPYVFRTDGRNKISFRIYPLHQENKNVGAEDYLKEHWEMCYDFVIYDIEDLETGSSHQKLRKYYFYDERYQILSERNIEYSTYYSVCKKLQKDNINPNTLPPQYWVDSKRAANPNEAIQDILTIAASDPPIYSATPTPVIYVGFSEEGSIDDPKKYGELLNKIDEQNWDIGKSDNLVLYTSPANSTAYDDINYMLNFCSSKDNGPVFLRVGRTTEDKKWKLTPLSQYFSEASLNQIERLYIEDNIVDGKPPINRSFSEAKGNYVNFSSGIESRIQSYRFSPMVASDDARITNSPVFNYDFSTGSFNIYFKDNTAIDVKTKLEDYAKKGLFNFSNYNPNSTNAHALLNINKTKKQGISVKNNFVPQKFFPKNLSQIQMLKDSVLLNEAITFTVYGLTIRTPGKFLYIDRVSSKGELNPFDDRFLGQWMIIKVNHIFTQKTYMTEIVAVKVDSFSKLWEENDTKTLY
jgi:hypothetical protein